ncbi:MAG: hypothetical protein JSS32_06175, partial [Verrucomicrobia bacterium]|nr:hypothetical protein [Verrucomicrobiota bacterium]
MSHVTPQNPQSSTTGGLPVKLNASTNDTTVSPNSTNTFFLIGTGGITVSGDGPTNSIIFSGGGGGFVNSVSSGGTGRSVLTAHGVLLGEGASPVNVTAPGSDGQLLISSTGADPVFSFLTSSAGTISFVAGPGQLNLEVATPGIGLPLSAIDGGTGRTILTDHGVMLGEGVSNVNVTAAGTNGQVLIGSTGADPAFALITSTSGTLSFVVGPGTLNIEVAFTGGLSGTVPVGNGGTGRTVLTLHGVLLGEGCSNVNVTAAGTNGQVLIGSTGLDPTFSLLTSSGGTISFVTGAGLLNLEVATPGLPVPVPVALGGTGTTSFGQTTSSVVYFNGSNLAPIASGNTGELLFSQGVGFPPIFMAAGAPGTINLTDNFGTSISSAFFSIVGNTASGFPLYTQFGGTKLFINLNTISVVYGGTGRTVLTSSGVLLGSGSNAVDVTAAGTNGQVLIGSSTGDPFFSLITSSAGTLTFTTGPGRLNIEVASALSSFVLVPSGGTGRTVLTTSGVLLGEGSNSVNVTAAGTDGQVLIGSSTGDPAFSAITSSAGTLSFTIGPNLLNIEVVSISSLTAPLSVTSGGTGRTVLTTSGVLIGEGSNNINVTAAGINGQILIGSSAGDPAFSALTSSAGTLSFTPGPNLLNIEVVSIGTLIAPLSVASGGTGRTVLTTSGVLLGEGSNNINATAAGTDGQVLIGSSSGDPAFSQITSSSGTLSFTTGPNLLNIEVVSIGSLISPLSVPSGGTGRTVLTTSGVLIGEGSNNVNVTAAGTDGQVLIGSSTGDPAFSALTSSAGTLSFTTGPNLLNIEVVSIGSLISPLSVPSGGTGRTVLTTSGVLLGEGSNNINVTAAGTNGQILIGSSAGDPAFSALTSSAGTLSFTTGANLLNIEVVSIGSLITPLSVPSGGTGRTVLTTSGVLIGEGSNNVNVTAPGTDGQVLIGSSTGDPSFSAITSSGGTLSFTTGPNLLNIEVVSISSLITPLSVTSGGTGRTVLTTSGVLLGEGSNNVNVTAAGTDGQVLIGSSTGDPAFSQITSSSGTLSFTAGPNLLNIEVVSIGSLIAPLTVPSGGTGRTVLTTSGVLLGEGSNNVNVTAAGTNGQVLIGSSAGDPAFATITSFTGTLTFIVNPNNLSIDLAAPVPIGFGGTNNTSFGTTNSSVLYFDGSRITSVGPGSTGQILTSNGSGTAPSFQSPSMQSATSLSLSGVITVTPPTSIALINTSFSITGPTTTAALYS